MPRLLIFVPCDLAVISQGNNATLVNVINEVEMQNIPEIIPDNAASPMRWYIYVEWLLTTQDRNHPWEQRTRLLNSTGDITRLEHIAEFTPEADKPRHRVIAQLPYFPVLPPGDYELEVSIRATGTQSWGNRATYPLILKRIQGQ